MSPNTVPAHRHTRTTPKRRWWQRPVEDEYTPILPPPRVPAPQLDPNRPQRPAPAPHRDHATDPDIVLVNVLEVVHKALKHRYSSTAVVEALAVHNAELARRSGLELEAAETIHRRLARNTEQAEQMGSAMELAAATGTVEALDPARLARTMAARSVQATDPNAPTGLIPVVRDEEPPLAVRLWRGGVEVRLSDAHGTPQWRAVAHVEGDDDIVSVTFVGGAVEEFTPDFEAPVRRVDVTAAANLRLVPAAGGVASPASLPGRIGVA